MGYKLQLTNLQNVFPGNTATLKCPAGPGSPTYDQIKLVLGGGLLPSHLTTIRGKANGRIFHDEASGTIVAKRDAYRGIATDNGFVVLDFTEPRARNGAAEQLVASIPGALLQDLSFEIAISSAAPSGSTLTATAVYRPPTNNPFIRKQLNSNQSFAAAGTGGSPNILYLPVGGAGGKLKRLWIREDGAGAVQSAEIRIANNVVHNVTRLTVENDQRRNNLVPQAGMFILDFVEDGNLAGMLDTSKAPMVELRLLTSAAGTYNVDYELIDPIGRL
jgi:hypothetical protein